MAFTPANIKRVDNYSTVDLSSKSQSALLQLIILQVYTLGVYGSDGYMPVFLGSASSDHAPLFFKALDDILEGTLIRGPQITFHMARGTL